MLLYLNEYHVAQAVYTLHGDSKLWLDNIAKAQVRESNCSALKHKRFVNLMGPGSLWSNIGSDP